VLCVNSTVLIIEISQEDHLKQVVGKQLVCDHSQWELSGHPVFIHSVVSSEYDLLVDKNEDNIHIKKDGHKS